MADDECLQVEQPEGGQEHEAHQNGEQCSRQFVIKSRESSEAESREIGRRADQRQRNSPHSRVGTAEDLGTATDYRALNAAPGDVFDGEIDPISQTKERDQSRGPIERYRSCG